MVVLRAAYLAGCRGLGYMVAEPACYMVDEGADFEELNAWSFFGRRDLYFLVLVLNKKRVTSFC